MKRLSTTLKVRLISNFLQLIITTAFIPFIALYLTDMLSQSIVGIYLVGLVVLKFPLSIISGYLIEIFPKKLLVLIYQATVVIMLVFMGVFGSHQLWQIIGFCVAYAIFTIVWGLQFPVMDTLIMDAITEDVEHYIYKISYWGIVRWLDVWLQYVTTFLNSSLYIFNCTLYFIYLVTSRPKSSKAK